MIEVAVSNTKSAGIFIIVGGRKVRARVCRGANDGAARFQGKKRFGFQ